MASTRLDRAAAAERDRLLLQRIRCGDHDALRDLFYAYYGELTAFAKRQLRVANEASDVVQDVFASIWNRRGCLDIQASISSYLYGAVRLRSRDVRVHQIVVEKYIVEADRPHGEITPVGAIVHNLGEQWVRMDEIAEALEGAVRKLPDRTQEIYRLSRYHHFSHRDIAATLGLSVNTVNVQMNRALRAINKAISMRSPRVEKPAAPATLPSSISSAG